MSSKFTNVSFMLSRLKTRTGAVVIFEDLGLKSLSQGDPWFKHQPCCS